MEHIYLDSRCCAIIRRCTYPEKFIYINTVPDKEKRVDGEGGVADRLEHKVPLGDSAQDLVLCKVHTCGRKEKGGVIGELSVKVRVHTYTRIQQCTSIHIYYRRRGQLCAVKDTRAHGNYTKVETRGGMRVIFFASEPLYSAVIEQ